MKFTDKISLARGASIVEQAFEPERISRTDVVGMIAAYFAIKGSREHFDADFDKHFDHDVADRAKEALDYHGQPGGLWEMGLAWNDFRFVNRRLAARYPDVNTLHRIQLSR